MMLPQTKNCSMKRKGEEEGRSKGDIPKGFFSPLAAGADNGGDDEVVFLKP